MTSGPSPSVCLRALLVSAGVLLTFTVAALGGQTTPVDGGDPSTLAFEAASIKRNVSNTDRMGISTPPGRYIGTNVPLRTLILNAYQLAVFQLIGLPHWAATERYDINAKVPDGLPPPPATVPGAPGRNAYMMRNLLAERFKFAAHQETRDLPIYRLTLAREDRRLGPQLTQVGDVACGSLGRGATAPAAATGGQQPCLTRIGRGSFSSGATTVDSLAVWLTTMLQREVRNETGLRGQFDVTLTFAGDPMAPGGLGVPAANDSAPVLTTAVVEQLGLKLESSSGPVRVLVVDRIERPTED